MEPPETARRLIVNADDFGRSSSINRAVAEAHRSGILTTASLMVNGDASEEAVAIAKANPNLGVGLHLTLVCSRATLPAQHIPELASPDGHFNHSPVAAGFRYFFRRSLREPLRREIAAQFERFHQTGLPLDHVNGHLNLHLHPVILDLLLQNAAPWGIERMRVTSDPFLLNARLDHGRWLHRISHALVFLPLARRARTRLRTAGIRHPRHVFGLLQNGCVTGDYILRLLPAIAPGDHELYSHPSLDAPRVEFDALISPEVRTAIQRHHIQLIRYRDL